MMPNWFGELLRDMLSGRQLRRIPRLSRRARAGLRLESLEDRSLASSTPVDVPLGTTSAQGATTLLTLSGNSNTVDQFLASVSGFSGPGLERVLEDIQQLDYSSNRALPLVSITATTPTTSPGEVSPPTAPPPSPAAPSPPPLPPDIETNPEGTSASFTAGASPLPSTWSASVSSQLTSVSWTFSLTSDGGEATQAFTLSQAVISSAFPVTGTGQVGDLTYEEASSGQAQPPLAATPPSVQVAEPRPAVTTSPAVTTGPADRDLVSPEPSLRAGSNTIAPGSPSVLTQTFLPPAPTAQAAPVVPVVSVTIAPGSNGTTTLELAPLSFAPVAPPSTSIPAQIALAEVPDHVLLGRFVEQREQTAFTELVRRYEPSVMAVTTRVLGDPHKAQDATQTTFLILARRAGTLDGRAPLSGWLYKVAYHLALRYQSAEIRRRRVERDAANRRSTRAESEVLKQIEKEELLWVLGEELQRLPEKYRAPLLLCYFEGRTHSDAAREIGLPRGSIAKRIGQGLERLRERLLDRGFLL